MKILGWFFLLMGLGMAVVRLVADDHKLDGLVIAVAGCIVWGVILLALAEADDG